MPSVVQKFRQALADLEENGQLESIVQLYTSEPRLSSLGREKVGPGSAEEFWTEYRKQFARIKSTFAEQIDDGNKSALFWWSEGELISGRPIAYQGVSLIETDGDLIRRFETIYDSAAFVATADKQNSSS